MDGTGDGRGWSSGKGLSKGGLVLEGGKPTLEIWRRTGGWEGRAAYKAGPYPVLCQRVRAVVREQRDLVWRSGIWGVSVPWRHLHARSAVQRTASGRGWYDMEVVQ